MKREKNFFAILAIAAICLALLCSCAEKKTGDDDDDDDVDSDDDDDSDAPDTGVGSYTVSLNMVPVAIGQGVQIQSRALYDGEGNAIEADSILLSEVIGNLAPFVEDAPSFTYEFVNFFEMSTLDEKGTLPGFDDLAQAAFYEGEGDAGLCIGWLKPGNEDLSLCSMEGGSLVTHPVDGAFDEMSLPWVNERTGDQPDHLGDVVALRGVVSVGSGVLVSGSYLKTFLEGDGYGLKIFADMGATEENDGYDGQLFSEIYTFEGDEVFVKGQITLHNGMIEFVPESGYHLAVLSRGNPVSDPVSTTTDELLGEPYRYAGVLVRVDQVSIVDIDSEDPTTDWPEYGTKSKEIRIKEDGASAKMGMPIYESTGIPGALKPEQPFDLVGIYNLDISKESSPYQVFPRKIEDVNPSDDTLPGTVRVSIAGEDAMGVVSLASLPACTLVLEEGGDPVLAVSPASIIQAAGITRNAKKLEYKVVASDGRKPFDTLIFDEMKSGVLYAASAAKEDGEVNSFFWEGMELSEIYYLNDVSDIQAFRAVEPPEEGDAVHGEGITLMINGKKYAINFDTLTRTEYEGKEAIAIGEFISDYVIELFTMSGSFTTDQIKMLYDYRLESYDGTEETIVRFDDLANGYLIMDDAPYTVFPEIGDSARVEDLYVIDMMRFIEVTDADQETSVVYLRDLETEEVEVEEGLTEEVVFFKTVLEAAGVDTSSGMYLYDFLLDASDGFSSAWTYGHNHLVDMYYRPYENRGFTVDPDLYTYGGRVSTKAIQKIRMIDVPQEAPSVEVMIDGSPVWGSDANSCEGCHYKNDAVQIPIDCMSCHTAP